MSLPLEHLSPRDSVFARFDPRWKLLAVGFAVVAVSLLSSLAFLAIAFVASLLLAAIARVPGRWFRVRMTIPGLSLLPFLIVLPFTIDGGRADRQCGFLHFSLDGLWVALELALKTLAVTALVLTALGTTPFHALLLAGQRLRLPSLSIQLTMMSYRYIFLLGDELHRLRIALRVRGFRNRADRHSYRTIGQVTGTLMLRGAERSERVAAAMRCRGFDGTFRALDSFRTTVRDVALFAGIVGFAAGLLFGETWG